VARTISVTGAHLDEMDELSAFVGEVHAAFGKGIGALLADSDPESMCKRLRAAIATHGHEVLIGRADGRIVGVSAFSLQSTGPWTDAASVHVHALVVAPGDRRRGVGRTMLGEVIARAEALGAPDVVVSAPTELRDAHRFYARFGFAPASTSRAATVSSLRRRMLPGSSRPRPSLEVRLRSRRRLVLPGDSGSPESVAARP